MNVLMIALLVCSAIFIFCSAMALVPSIHYSGTRFLAWALVWGYILGIGVIIWSIWVDCPGTAQVLIECGGEV